MQPNVLFIFVDSLRADHCLGSDRGSVTPALDALAAQSTVFTKAFATASTTTISAASTLSGAYPSVHGVRSLAGRRLPTELPTVAESFKSSGYRTWAEMTGPLVDATGLDRGFDSYAYRHYTEWLDTDFGDRLLDRIATEPGPWFGFLHLWEIHYPRRVTPGFGQPQFGGNLYERAVSSLDAQLGRLVEALSDDAVVVFTADHGEYISEARSAQLLSNMKGSTAWLKRRVPGVRKMKKNAMKRIFTTLDRMGRRDSDFYRAWLGHGFHVYEPLLNVPLFLRGAPFPAGKVIDHVVSHVDIFPTLVAGLGLDPSSARMASGVDLGPLMRGPSDASNGRVIYMEACGARLTQKPDQWLAGIRTQRHKYVRGLSNPQLPVELYDLETDPEERTNIADREPELVKSLESQLVSVSATAAASVATEAAYSATEMEEVEERLRDLGYLD